MKLYISIILFVIIAFELKAINPSVNIDGVMESLEVIGYSGSEIKISSDKPSSSTYTLKTQRAKTSISLEDNTANYRVYVPFKTSLVIKPQDIFFAGSGLEQNKDAIPVRLRNLKGNVEFFGDLFVIILHNYSASSSIVTYANIEGNIGKLEDGAFISLDTYLGNILLSVLPADTYNIKASAKKGKVSISENIKTEDSSNRIIAAHIESGQLINIKTRNIIAEKEKDSLIRVLTEIYLEDQGVQVIDRSDLEFLENNGYRDFISNLPKVPNWHRDYKNKHFTAIVKIMTEHGILKQSDIQDSFAWAGLRLAFMNNPNLRKKYPDQAKRLISAEVLMRLH